MDSSLLNGPALPPPDGIIPNFDDPPRNNGLGYGLLSMFFAIGTAAFALRLYAKLFCVKKLRLEDGTCLGRRRLESTVLIV